MPRLTHPLPGAEAWVARCGLTMQGRETVGPCPLCGGTDRFHVREGPDGEVLFGCRRCIHGQDSETKERRFWELMRAVFPDWSGFAPAL